MKSQESRPRVCLRICTRNQRGEIERTIRVSYLPHNCISSSSSSLSDPLHSITLALFTLGSCRVERAPPLAYCLRRCAREERDTPRKRGKSPYTYIPRNLGCFLLSPRGACLRGDFTFFFCCMQVESFSILARGYIKK